MEQAGLIQRARDPQDERRVQIDLTPEGRVLRASAETVPATLVAGLSITEGEIVGLRDQVRALVGIIHGSLVERS